jgi:hypothetical protein
METTTIKDIVTWKDGAIAISAKLGNYLLLAQDDLYLRTYASSLLYAAVTTLLCLAIGYPFAYFMARARRSLQPALADARDAAVLDLVPASRLRLEGAPDRAGPRGQRDRSGRASTGCSPPRTSSRGRAS